MHEPAQQQERGNRPERPRKTPKVGHDRICYLSKNNAFTASNQVKDTLEEIGVELCNHHLMNGKKEHLTHGANHSLHSETRRPD